MSTGYLTPGLRLMACMTWALSASWGTHLGLTKLVASTSWSPASASPSISRTFTSVATCTAHTPSGLTTKLGTDLVTNMGMTGDSGPYPVCLLGTLYVHLSAIQQHRKALPCCQIVMLPSGSLLFSGTSRSTSQVSISPPLSSECKDRCHATCIVYGRGVFWRRQWLAHLLLLILKAVPRPDLNYRHSCWQLLVRKPLQVHQNLRSANLTRMVPCM